MNAQKKYDHWLLHKDYYQEQGISLVDYWQEALEDAEQIGYLKGKNEGYAECQHDDKIFGSYHGDITLL